MTDKPMLPNGYMWKGDFIVVLSEGSMGEVQEHVIGAVYNMELLQQLLQDCLERLCNR